MQSLPLTQLYRSSYKPRWSPLERIRKRERIHWTEERLAELHTLYCKSVVGYLQELGGEENAECVSERFFASVYLKDLLFRKSKIGVLGPKRVFVFDAINGFVLSLNQSGAGQSDLFASLPSSFAEMDARITRRYGQRIPLAHVFDRRCACVTANLAIDHVIHCINNSDRNGFWALYYRLVANSDEPSQEQLDDAEKVGMPNDEFLEDLQHWRACFHQAQLEKTVSTLDPVDSAELVEKELAHLNWVRCHYYWSIRGEDSAAEGMFTGDLPKLQTPKFPDNRWTWSRRLLERRLILTVNNRLDELREAFWVPVYEFLQKLGQSEEDAKRLGKRFFGVHLQEFLFEQAGQVDQNRRVFVYDRLMAFVMGEGSERSQLADAAPVPSTMVGINERLQAYYSKKPRPSTLPEHVFARECLFDSIYRAHVHVARYFDGPGEAERFAIYRQHFAGLEESAKDKIPLIVALGETEEEFWDRLKRMRNVYWSRRMRLIGENVSLSDEEAIEKERDYLHRSLQCSHCGGCSCLNCRLEDKGCDCRRSMDRS